MDSSDILETAITNIQDEFSDMDMKNCIWPMIAALSLGGLGGVSSKKIAQNARAMFRNHINSLVIKEDGEIVEILKNVICIMIMNKNENECNDDEKVSNFISNFNNANELKRNHLVMEKLDMLESVMNFLNKNQKKDDLKRSS
jgi:hypothetical protein